MKYIILVVMLVSFVLENVAPGYDRASAVNYANGYCNLYNGPPPNGPYGYIRGKDCANFVSQCLIAGGMYMFYPNYGMHGWGGTYTVPERLKKWLDKHAKRVTNPACLQPGDVIIFEDNIFGIPYHSAIVKSTGPVRIAYHSPGGGEIIGICDGNYWSDAKFYHILDPVYGFESEFIGGYYFKFEGGGWQGPVRTQGVSAAGYKPASTQYFAGFSEFAILGIPIGSTIGRAFVRLFVNKTEAPGVLIFNIKFAGNGDPPTAAQCVDPPYELTNVIFEEETQYSWKFFELPPSLYDEILAANNQTFPFDLGYSNGVGNNAQRFFYDWADLDPYNVVLWVLLDDIPGCNVPGSPQSTGVISPSIKEGMSLENFPNPFSHSTLISYFLPNDSKVMLNVYNIAGEIVKTLVSENKFSGGHEIRWDGVDERGERVSAGVYFLRLSAGKESKTKKVVLLK